MEPVNRFERYVRIVGANLRSNTGGKFNQATGYNVVDKLHDRVELVDKIITLEDEDMFGLDWPTLFANAAPPRQDSLVILPGRGPQDERLQILIDGQTEPSP